MTISVLQARLMPIEDKDAAIDTVRRERASKEPGSVGSPMTAVVVNVMVQEGHEVKAGDPLATLSAMKLESNVTAPVSGRVKRIVVGAGDSINQGDLILEITHA
jgi:pyruvate carboxylase